MEQPHTSPTGKRALVTGSSSGIGYAIAETLAGEGCDVILHGIESESSMKEICKTLEENHGVEVLYYQADLSHPGEITSLVNKINADNRQVDILVNNAGVQYVAPVEAFPVEKWNTIISLNLSSAFHLIQGLLPGMKKRGFGRVVNIASAHGLVASPFKSAYVSAKHGLVGLTKCVALEVAECNITVNAVCPGYVLTPLLEKQIPATAKVKGLTEAEVIRNILLAAQPTKKFVAVDEIAALVCFLCSEKGASVTGTAIPVDGGWTAQ